jgi:ribosomal protein S6
MARQVDALSRRFINRNYPIVVIVDREQRNETAEQLSAQLIEKLESQGVDVSQFQVYLSTE